MITATEATHWPIEMPDRLELIGKPSRRNIRIGLSDGVRHPDWELILTADRTRKTLSGLLYAQPWDTRHKACPHIETLARTAERLSTPRSSCFCNRLSLSFVGFQQEPGIELLQAMIDVAANLPELSR